MVKNGIETTSTPIKTSNVNFSLKTHLNQVFSCTLMALVSLRTSCPRSFLFSPSSRNVTSLSSSLALRWILVIFYHKSTTTIITSVYVYSNQFLFCHLGRYVFENTATTIPVTETEVAHLASSCWILATSL